MSVGELLGSDAGLTAVGAILGGAWTLFKSTEWFGALKQQRTQRAVQVLEAGVEETYRAYVQAIKASRADGSLTAEEKQHARELALQRALDIARKDGIDLVRELGGDYIQLWLAKAVNQQKRG
jgi:uncharacterized membrane protein YebE (DUF533 family)